MTEDNDNGEDFAGFAEFVNGLASGSSKPDTAEGVAELLNEAVAFVAEHKRSKVGVLQNDEDGSAIPIIMAPDGGYEMLSPETLDAFKDRPSRRRGTATVTSLQSLIDHVKRFGDEDSAVFVCDDRASPSITAVLDYNRKDIDDEHGEYRHGLHRTFYRFPLSDEWKAWHARNAEMMTMPAFAAFLEDNVLDVAEIEAVPESAKRFVEMGGGEKNIADWSMLTKLAKGLAIFENSVVTEAVNLSSGEGQLTLGNAHDTEIEGVKVKVPTMFFIAIPIFREGAIYRLPVRLRYRKSGQGVVFWFELWRSDRAFTDAVQEAVEKVGTETGAQVFYGSPE